MPVTQAERNKIATNVWTARVIPIVLAGVVGYASYVLVALLCGTPYLAIFDSFIVPNSLTNIHI
jgi:hypothetical protein